MALVSFGFVYSVLLIVIFCVSLNNFVLAHLIVSDSVNTPEFTKHTLIKPKIYHGREKRQISTSEEEDGTHTHDLTIGYDINGIDYILDLRLNRELLPKGYFQKYQQQGKHVVNKPTGKDVELCQYQGTLRGVEGSWAALSTCHKGLSGVIFDGNEMHYLEKVNSSDTESGLNDIHYLYKHSDLMENNKSCGFNSNTNTSLHNFPSDSHHILENNEYNRILRYKRSTSDRSIIRGPYNANKRSRYVELVMVVDQQEYKYQKENLQRVNNRCKDIANIINALYAPLNIFIALVGVVVWTEVDEIKLSENGDTTLSSFLHYRRERLVKEHPNDNAQLLTRIQFEGGVVGKALKGPICTYEFSGGVSMDHSNTVGLVATTIAHEMGHNFGMEHDTSDCKCPEERCIMSPSSSSLSPKHWSSCSLDYLALAFEHGMDYCLRNKPEHLFDSPVCGNGFVEPGEQCDCGLVDKCQNTCCNATTCMLHSNASCATGECCDLVTCRPKKAGTLCRSADHECDLPEYCTGQSEYCPNDVYKMDTEMCDNDNAFCYQGSCRTRTDQCKLLWGPSGLSSDECYNLNDKGNRHGNCGYNRINASYIKCKSDHVLCGMLHCRHLNEKLEFGMESVAILSHSFINSKGSIIPCRNAIVDLGLNEIDPGLTPDGAKCGDGKMCVNQKCMPVASLRTTNIPTCPDNCNGNGFCNSKGHCHCKDGFSPPNCDYPGVGGSVDSGPASDPNANREFVTAMYIIFLGIIPLTALSALLFYYQRHSGLIVWPKQSGKTYKSPKANRGHLSFTSSNAPQNMDIRNDDNSSLLPCTDASNSPTSGINNNFFGHFKGFSLTPMAKSVDVPTVNTTNCTTSPLSDSPFIKSDNKPIPQRTAPPVPVVPDIVFKSPKPITKSNSMQHNKSDLKSPVHRSNTMRNEQIDTSPAPALPPLNPGANPRPLISNPILENSTCTAKELQSPLKNVSKVPIRPAPEVPCNNKPRPMSNPNILEDIKRPKENSSSALGRFASFLKSKEEKPKIIFDVTKLDKNQLKNIEISNPILQTEIDIAVTAIPVDNTKQKEKNVVMRAQSMRNGQITQRPAIHTFGSMRQPNYTKRPTSIPVANRPANPPPPRPETLLKNNNITNKIPGLPGYQVPKKDEYSYDDCISNNPKLKNINEEATNVSNCDNIYAVIEESPSSDYQSPKSLENRSNSGSSESMGLLGEIVSEIQNRNFDSIYSTSTLARKRKENKEQSKIKSDDENDKYVNTSSIYKSPEDGTYSNMSSHISSANSTTSSGYLHPSAVNAPKTVESNSLSSAVQTVPMSTFKGTDDKSKTDYKPFSSTFQRNSGPLASGYTNMNKGKTNISSKLVDDKKSTEDKKLTKQTAPTNLKRQTTPPNLNSSASNLKRQITPPNLKRQITPPNIKKQNPPNLNRQTTPPNLKANSKAGITNNSRTSTVSTTPKNLPKIGQKPLNNSPDLVSSCATSSNTTIKSPDVINNSDNSKNITAKTTLKTVSKQPSTVQSNKFRDPSPNATNKKKSLPTRTNSSEKPIIVPKPSSLNKQDSSSDNKAMPLAARQAASKLSNVASLQQKFEANKTTNNKNQFSQSK